MLLALNTLGVAVNGYATNIAQDVAISTARFASLADSSLPESKAYSLQLLNSALGSLFRPEVSVFQTDASGLCESESKVTLHPVALGLLSSGLEIEETAHVVCELQGR